MKIKKLLAIGALAVCFMMSSVTTFAFTENSVLDTKVIATANFCTGSITANNVNIRTRNGTSLGQVNYGNKLKMDMESDLINIDGNLYRYVTMTSGQNKGTSGWVCIDYFELDM